MNLVADPAYAEILAELRQQLANEMYRTADFMLERLEEDLGITGAEGLRAPASRKYWDHHLKGEPAPSWMVDGVPFLEKKHGAWDRGDGRQPGHRLLAGEEQRGMIFSYSPPKEFFADG